MYRQIIADEDHSHERRPAAATAKHGDPASGTRVGLITLADVSMSLDNVLAVAGAAKGSTLVLVIGLAIAIVLMAVASHYIARLLGQAIPGSPGSASLIILWVALDMIYDGSHKVDVPGLRGRLLGGPVARHPAPIGADADPRQRSTPSTRAGTV